MSNPRVIVVAACGPPRKVVRAEPPRDGNRAREASARSRQTGRKDSKAIRSEVHRPHRGGRTPVLRIQIAFATQRATVTVKL
jgi:hypothetical protein